MCNIWGRRNAYGGLGWKREEKSNLQDIDVNGRAGLKYGM
jgi:hypothetical protein